MLTGSLFTVSSAVESRPLGKVALQQGPLNLPGGVITGDGKVARESAARFFLKGPIAELNIGIYPFCQRAINL